jgi:hypothetical protein
LVEEAFMQGDRKPQRARWFVSFYLAVAALASGCFYLIPGHHVARVTNLTDAACRSTLNSALEAALTRQGETPPDAAAMSTQAVDRLAKATRPGEFAVPGTSGVRYDFLVQYRRSGCLLRLYGREKGEGSVTNGVTFFDTRPLPGCSCDDYQLIGTEHVRW